MSRPRVAMIVRLFAPWVGGTELQAQHLATELADHDVDVRVVTGWWFRGTSQRETIDGVPVFRNTTLWEFFGIRGLRKVGGYIYMVSLAWHLWRTRAGYDVIHAHGMNYHSAVAVWTGERLGKPTITKIANSGEASDILKMREDRQLAGSRFLLSTALRSTRFVALTDAVRDELLEAGVDAERIVRLPNGVDAPPDDDSLRRRNGTGVHAVYVGRLHTQKSLATLIEAMGKLGQQHPDVHLSLIGDGPDREALEQQVGVLGVGDRVHFVGQSDDVSALLREADVFVLPSLVEGLSNALLEAMAHRLAVVVSDIPGNLAVVADGENGLTFPVGDASALADRLARLASDPSERERLSANARRTVDSRFALPAVAEQYRDLYAGLARQEGSQP
ncbi:MAG: glycosyltransferase family 4 protein [Actinomycetota bacterium]